MSAENPQRTRDPGGDDGQRRSVAMHTDPRFADLKRRLVRFVFPMSVAFLTWYLLYVLMSAYARGVMGHELIGSMNVALVFGLLQFLTTFGIAILYSRYADRRLDPLAGELRAELSGAAPEAGDGGGARTSKPNGKGDRS